MHCKFLKHGIAIGYDNRVRPCCTFQPDQNTFLSVYETDLSTYHKNEYIQSLDRKLSINEWPSECRNCKMLQEQGVSTVMDGGNQAYKHYAEDDITLEIRPGNVCNFACQTCWPAASSRVTSFWHQAGFDLTSPIIGPGIDATKSINDYSFLDNIKHRIKDVIVLGGEPFYDKNCLKFLDWATKNLSATITLFTNTSIIKDELIKSYTRKFVIVSSIDAIGKPAEYIRFGTEWETVEKNYKKLKTFNNVINRVNITSSAYNFYHISDVIDFLIDDWPEVVTFGSANEPKFRESVVPNSMREEIIDRLHNSIIKLKKANIVLDQKQNAVMNCNGIINKLQNEPYSESRHLELKQYSKRLDEVKKIRSSDYGNYLNQLLNY